MRIRTAASLALIFCVASCSGGGSTAPASNTGGKTGGTTNTGGSGGSMVPANTVIARVSDQFDPAALTVSVGTTVTFTFESTAHNVTFNPVNGHPADIPGNNANISITRTFSVAGTFPYQCTIHSGMTGTITVQ